MENMAGSPMTLIGKKYMVNYVLGFMFPEEKDYVALIRKERPEWQAGKLNGIGGHIEQWEGPHTAMEREFLEETGVDSKELWTQFAVLTGTDWKMYVFKAFTDIVFKVETKTDEDIGVYWIPDLDLEDRIYNLKWLIPMALDNEVKLVEVKL